LRHIGGEKAWRWLPGGFDAWASDDSPISALWHRRSMLEDWRRPRNPQQQIGFDLMGISIKRRRRSLGWTQRYLEMMSGVDQTVISRIENGKQYGLRWAKLAELVEALGGLDASTKKML
jgi:ribosome-binding protein aMBF1 (putative translation factor)